MGAMTQTAGRQDAGVLASAAAGDEIAFRRIIGTHHEDMRRVCAVVCGDDGLADEARRRCSTVRVKATLCFFRPLAWGKNSLI